MQAVILAAGKGTRLRPLTNEIPKPMIQVGGKPILERTLSILPDAIDEALIVVGYRGDAVKKHFGNQFGKVKLTYVDQGEPRGTGHALLAAKPHITSKQFLLLNSDDLYHHADLHDAVQRGEPTVLVVESQTPERFGACMLDEKGCVLEILEKRENPPTNLVNIGAYVLDHNIFEFPAPLLPNGELNLAEQIGNWARENSVYAKKARLWHPINNMEELGNAENVIKELDADSL